MSSLALVGKDWRLLIFTTVVFLISSLIGQGNLTKRKFDPGPGEKLSRHLPVIVLIGDSMLETRIDNDVLKKISGLKFEKMVYPGSGSAAWYLFLKNHLVSQPQPPKVVAIFFRDMQLTLADYHTKGRYRPRLEALMLDRGEPFLESTVQSVQKEQAGGLLAFSQKIYPLQSHQLEWQEKIYTKALIYSTPPDRRPEIREQTNRLFSARHLRTDAGAYAEGDDTMGGLDPADHSFEAALPRSFLPSILEMAAHKKISLVFFRVKRRPQESGKSIPEPPYLTAYAASLRQFVEKAGARYVDETRDEAIGRDFYGGDDHLREDRMADYTELFWNKYGAKLSPVGKP